ncbi:MAG: TldD/PmbA family protein [bacterium]|nr:TldD/PmbA family protein [bacterium]
MNPTPSSTDTLLDGTDARRIIDTALITGADFAEIFLEDRATRRLTFNDSRIKEAASGHSLGAGIRVIRGHQATYAYTSDLSPGALEQLARDVAEASRAADTPGSRKGEALAGGQTGLDLPTRLWSGDQLDVPALFERIDRVTRGASERISQVEVLLAESLQSVQIMNSDGLVAAEQRPLIRLTIQAIGADGHEFQTGTESPGVTGDWRWLAGLDVDALALSAARQALTMLSAGHAPSGRMPVIIDSGFGGVILHEACGHLLETTSVAPGTSVLSGKMGEMVAHPSVSVIDDGTIEGAWGSLAIDDEGMATRRSLLIERGKLVSYIVDRLGGIRTGYAPTGSGRRESYRYAPTSRMRNTFIAPGEGSVEELVSEVKLGLYAARMGGGSVSPGTGDFNFSVREAYVIRDGRIAEPVRGATLIGNGAEILHKIDRVGSDLQLAAGYCGSISGSLPVCVGQPPIRVSEIVVGGRA